MEQKFFMDKYSIYTRTINKTDLKQKNIDEICEFFINKIKNHPKGAYIGMFNHFEHTTKIDGTIADEIKDAKLVIFCFGQMLINTDITAIRPRSFGVIDIGDKVVVNFQEPPMAPMRDTMIEWVSEL
ncbi:MAG: hypothetical protein RL154_258 [Pseudomonadota bacterium]|jgi:hypothetical protein